MFKIFSYENIIETINKKPLVCFYTENGGCGTSGLFVVIFDDN